jgi:hypothetical protein
VTPSTLDRDIDMERNLKKAKMQREREEMSRGDDEDEIIL